MNTMLTRRRSKIVMEARQPIDFIDLTNDSASDRMLNHIDVRENEVIHLDETLSYPSSSTENNNRCVFDTSQNNDDKFICAVCLDTITPRKNPIVTKCGHIYCKNCLEPIIKLHKKCPLCRRMISSRTCIQIRV